MSENGNRQKLPDSSRRALLHIAEALRRGFTGTFEITANQGGVKRLRENRTVSTDELLDEKTQLA